MKRLLFSAFTIFATLGAFSQTLTELVVPQYFSGRTAASANNARMPLVFCFQITGLTANQTYDLKLGLALTTEASTSYGAGNQWTGTTLTNANWIGAFTTNASGNSGPVWGVIQPTGNSTGGRFLPGSLHNIRYGIVATTGTMPSSASFVGSKTITALDLGTTALTSATTDDGAFIQGTAQAGGAGKFVCAYSNTAGTGDPIAVGVIRSHSYNQGVNNELPSAIDSILNGTNNTNGAYALLIPIGANNSNGIQRLEIRNNSNTVLLSSTTSTGVWPSTANTTTVTRRGVVFITSTDAPLPVKLTSFTAEQANQNVVLNWVTAVEINNNGFEVEKSFDGKNFEKIAFVKGNGTSSHINKYQFVDAIAGKQISTYYRLKQVDFDGEFSYSDVVKISNENQLDVVVGPNPFSNEIKVTSTQNIHAIEVIDVTGKVCFSSNPNSSTYSFKLDNVNNGVYFIRVNNGEQTISKRIIKN